MRKYFQLYLFAWRALLPLCHQDPVAVYKLLEHFGFKPWGVAPQPSLYSNMGIVYFTFNGCQFALRIPNWAIPKEVLEDPKIKKYERGTGFEFLSLDTNTCINFYLRDKEYEYKREKSYFLEGVVLTFTQDGEDAVMLHITPRPGHFFSTFVFTGDRLVYHSIIPPSGSKERIDVAIELFRSYLNCCKTELIQAISCANELFSKLEKPLTIYILY